MRISKIGTRSGFTLTELVTVLVILGIIAAFTAPRFFDRTVFDELGFYQELVAALRYGSKIAVGSGCPVQVSISASGCALAQQAGRECGRMCCAGVIGAAFRRTAGRRRLQPLPAGIG